MNLLSLVRLHERGETLGVTGRVHAVPASQYVVRINAKHRKNIARDVK